MSPLSCQSMKKLSGSTGMFAYDNDRVVRDIIGAVENPDRSAPRTCLPREIQILSDRSASCLRSGPVWVGGFSTREAKAFSSLESEERTVVHSRRTSAAGSIGCLMFSIRRCVAGSKMPIESSGPLKTQPAQGTGVRRKKSRTPSGELPRPST